MKLPVLVAALSLALALPVLGDDPSANSLTVAEGRKAIRAQDFVSAAMILEAVTEREPKNAAAWQLFGYALHAQGRIEEALDAHLVAASFPGTAGASTYNAACAYALLGRDDEALAALAKARTAGFDISSAQSDPDLRSLRDDPRFTALFPKLLEGEALFVEKPRILYTLVGEAAGDQFGWVARTVGDLDGDGCLDFAATSPTHGTAGPASGRVYVYSGRQGKLLFAVDGKPGEQLGNSVAPAGDVDGDGTPDVVAGGPASGNAAGVAYVFSGRDGSVLHRISAGEAGDSFGIKVCGLGDLDGDDRSELFVGASGSNAKGQGSGCGYVYSGASGELLFTLEAEKAGDGFGSSADATTEGERRLLAVGAMTAGPRGTGKVYVYELGADGAELAFTIDGDETSANLGQYFVAIAGDVDGDGEPDVYASDWNNAARGPATGRVFVHSGTTGERILTLTGTTAGEGFGTSPSTAGDVNGDGHADFIVGAWQHASAAPSGGRCYLLSGKDGAELATYTCRQAGDTFGFDAVGIGDVDGDGGTDFLLTSAWSPALGPRTGRVFVIAGPTFE